MAENKTQSNESQSAGVSRRDLFHIIGSTNAVYPQSNAYFNGLLVTDGTIQTANQTTFISDPNLYAHPPIGYGSGTLMIVPGSWIWDSPP